MKKLIAITIALFGAAACVEAPPDLGGPPIDDPVDDPVDIPISDDPVVDDPADIPDLGTPEAETAHGIYIKEVYPSLKAACGACHVPDNGNTIGPQWLDGAEEASYILTKGYKDGAFLTKDPASSLLIAHKHTGAGTELTTEQVDIVTKWINKENEENPTGGTDPTPTGATLTEWLKCFAGAMDYTRFETTGMANFAQQQTQEGVCSSCHNQGVGATYLNADPLLTFDHMKEQPYILRLVKPVYDSGVIVALALETRMIDKGGEDCATPPNCHPKFQMTAARQQALTDFVLQTGDAMDLAACGIK